MIDLPVAAWILLYLAQPLLLLVLLALPLPGTSDADPLRRMRVVIAAVAFLPVPGAGLALTIIGLGLLAARRHRLLARSVALGDELTAAGARSPAPLRSRGTVRRWSRVSRPAVAANQAVVLRGVVMSAL